MQVERRKRQRSKDAVQEGRLWQPQQPPQSQQHLQTEVVSAGQGVGVTSRTDAVATRHTDLLRPPAVRPSASPVKAQQVGVPISSSSSL
jgi:hypothetical protein